MNLALKSYNDYLELLTNNINNREYYLQLIYQNKLIVVAMALALYLLYRLAKRQYLQTIKYFRSGDVIQIWKLTGKTRSGVLSKFDSKNIYFIPNNSYQIVQQKWYWFFLMENLSRAQRGK